MNNLLSNIVEITGSIELGDNDRKFIERVYADGLAKYQQRLAAIGFKGHKNVLDAGCGFGQWTMALASLNQSVEACDILDNRVAFTNLLKKKFQINNINAQVSGLESLPYEEHAFDAVFCYGVVFATAWKASLQEMARVLKPGGTLYLTANDIGWFVFLWTDEHNKAEDYDPKAVAARAFTDTLNYEREGVCEPGMNLIIDPESLQNELRLNGLEGIQQANEGGVHLNHDVAAPKPFFRGEYCGQAGVYEIVCTKPVC